MTDKEKYLGIGYITSDNPPYKHKSEKKPLDVKEFRRNLLNACDTSDHKVAVLLSGGLDSSLIAWALKKLGKDVTAYCVGYTDHPGEVAGAQWVAKKLHIPLKVIKISPEQCFEVFPYWVKAMPRIHSEWSGLPLAMLMMEVSREFNYVFTGDGGDDLFGGYAYFKALYDLEKNLDDAVKTPERRAVRFYSIMRDVVQSPKMEKYLIPKLTEYFKDVSLIEGLSDWTVEQWLYQGMMYKSHTAMAMSGMMIYAPLIELDEYANTIIDEDRIEKKAIRELLKTTCLRKLATKPKMGFKPPFTQWFQSMPWAEIIDGTGNFRQDLINFRKIIWDEKNK